MHRLLSWQADIYLCYRATRTYVIVTTTVSTTHHIFYYVLLELYFDGTAAQKSVIRVRYFLRSLDVIPDNVIGS
jgi:hypothetical protein